MIPFATLHERPEEILQALSALHRNRIRRVLDEHHTELADVGVETTCDRPDSSSGPVKNWVGKDNHVLACH